MSIVTALLNGTNLNRDSHIETPNIMTLTPGVRKGFSTELKIETNLCKAGMALVEVTRTTVTPNETFLVLVQITADETIDTSGDGYIVIKIDAAKIADGSSNNTDGTGIATIEKVAVLPSNNFLELCSLAGGVITDTREYCTFQDNILPFGKYYAEDAGASDAYAITIEGLKEYVDGMMIAFKANTANTGAATLNINSLGAKNLEKIGTEALDNNDIIVNQIVVVRYNSDNDNFVITNQVANAVDTSAFVKTDGTRPFTGNQSLGGFKLTSVADPAAAQDAATQNYVQGVKNDGKPLVIHSYQKTLNANNAVETQYETVSIPAGFTAGVIQIEVYANVYGFYTGTRRRHWHVNFRWTGLTSKGYVHTSWDTYNTTCSIAGAISGTLSMYGGSGGTTYRYVTVSVSSITAGDGNDVQIQHTTTIAGAPGTNSTWVYAIVTVWPA